MKHADIFTSLVCAYVAFWVGLAVASVGQIPKGSGPYDWTLPFQVLVMLAIPSCLGYLAGRGIKP